MLKDFKAFILRGNVVDLAIGVAIGAAFSDVIKSFTENLLTPLLAIPGDRASFADLAFAVGKTQFKYGLFIDALVAFLIVAFVLFFFVVRPVNHLMNRRRTEVEVEETTRECPECLSSIPRGARRCAFCTATLTPA